MKNIKCTIFILTVLAMFAGVCFAQDLSFEATVDRTRVALGQDVQLELTFYGTQNIATPYFPDIPGFSGQYLGPSKLMSIVNGSTSTSITHRYRLRALRKGSFTIPSFSIQHRGKTYATEPISVVVNGGASTQAQQTQSQSPKAPIQGLEDRIFIDFDIGKTSAYVNEIVPVIIKLYINRLAIRDIQYPEFSHEGFSRDTKK